MPIGATSHPAVDTKADSMTRHLQHENFLEKQRQILLELGNDITRVREKNDLITLFSKRIKGLFYFTHTMITLIDVLDDTYKPFLLDHESSPIRTHPDYALLVNARFSLDEPFIKSVLETDYPVIFELEDEMAHPQSPVFLRANYDMGVKQVLMMKLMNADKPIGFIHIYSDRTDSFTQDFKDIIRRISSQLSSAVSNIIKNEDIRKKEEEKSFLLDFSNDMTSVRTKEDLAVVVRTTLRKLTPEGGYVIRKINEDDLTMSAYVYDPGTARGNPSLLKEVLSAKFPINDGLQNRVLDSYIPLLFSVSREAERGIKSKYLDLWQDMGFKTMVGIALRNGNVNIGLLWLSIDEINIPILQGICAQIAVAMNNIMANEELLRKQQEQSFLLDFSNDIAGVMAKADLETAVFKVLDRLLNTKLAMLRLIDDDGQHLSPYMFDKSLFEGLVSDFDKLSEQKITTDEHYTALVLKSSGALVLNVEEQMQTAHKQYAALWGKTGFKNMYAAVLKVGDQILGTIWMLADHLSMPLFKGICAQISTAVSNIKASEKISAYRKRLEDENDYLKEQIRTIYNFSEMIGSGKQMQQVYRLISLVAESNSTVMICGETGTGKELVARAVHNASLRKDKLMIKLNCAAMPANLIESELFGHERGAFTGAVERRIGKFELANNSTLFLDEIGEMPMEAQVKLLRVLQEREMERVGGKTTIKLDVRVIAATNRDLEEEVRAGRFRSDLFYRLNVFPIKLPPLRDRIEDIDALTEFFLSKYAKTTGRKVTRISPKVMQQLRSYLWPGNVRELEHVMERSVLLANDHTVREIYLPDDSIGSVQLSELPGNRSLEEVERTYIIEVLKRCSGKISGTGGAAEILGIPGNTLHSKIKKLQIHKADYFSN
ncbi:formate hydrogenlyase transcriptional activator [Pedobacter africanus]